MSGASAALKASIKALGPEDITTLPALRQFSKDIAAVSPSRGLAIAHSRYPKETEDALRKLGFTNLGDPNEGLAGPGALLDLVASGGLAVSPYLAVMSHGRNGYEAQKANTDRKNQVVKWLLGQPSNKDKGDENLENITRVRKVWDATFEDDRQAFAALGPRWWDEKNPETYKAYRKIVDGIMATDVVMAQAGIYNAPPSASGQQKTPDGRAASPISSSSPSQAWQGGARTSTELTPGTPEFEQEKQRRVAYWKQKEADRLRIETTDTKATR